MRIMSITDIQVKWATVTPTRSDFYSAGVSDTSVKWADYAAAAESSWAQGTAAAAAGKRFSRGVGAAGDNTWRAGCQIKGVTEGRWSNGVRGATAKYGLKFGPYQAALAGMTLPKRGTRGSPENIGRVAFIANQLHALKVTGAR